MTIEPKFGRREVLLAGTALGVAWVLGGCTDDEDDAPDGGLILPTVYSADVGLERGFKEMYAWLSPEDRALLDAEIMKRKDVLVHIIRGKLYSWESRGGASTLAPTSKKGKKKKWNENRWCSLSRHPDVKGIPRLRNWDLVYDEQRAKEEETKENGIPNPIDVVLYHEIFGHILRILRNPKILNDVYDDRQQYDKFEDEARVIENRYRSYRGLKLFPVPPKGSTP